MKLLNTLIVENDLTVVNTLESFFQHLPFIGSPSIARSTGEAISHLRGATYDIMFWSTSLHDSQGIGILKSFDYLPPVVVLSNDIDCTLEAFEMGVLDFLQKPCSFERVLKSINRLQNYQLGKGSVADQEAIFLKVGRQMKRFYYKDILCAEALSSYTKVITNRGIVVVNETLSDLIAKLPQDLFMRVHKSYLINLSHLSAFDTKRVVVGELEVPLGVSYRPHFEKYLRLLDDSQSLVTPMPQSPKKVG